MSIFRHRSTGKFLLAINIGVISAFVFSVVFSGQAAAAYKGNRLIDNSVFLHSKSMSKSKIQDFLVSKGSGLASKNKKLSCGIAGSKAKQLYLAAGAPCGSVVPVSHMIYYASQVYGVSPKVILATLQKEQGLITSPDPASWQMKQAMGYACPSSGNCNNTSTFFYQVDNGTWALRYHYERANGNMSWWSPSSSWTCGSAKEYYKPSLYPGVNTRFYDDDGVQYRTHNLKNAATSALYCYTPHAYNNFPDCIPIYGVSYASWKPTYGSVGRCYSGSYNFVYWFEIWWGSTQTNTPYAWKVSDVSAYSNSGKTNKFTSEITVEPGDNIYVTLKATNMGYKTWSNSNTRLGTAIPRDRNSVFEDASWVNSRRPAQMQESSVDAGETGTFNFVLEAPNTPGTYSEGFRGVVELKSWLAPGPTSLTINVVERESIGGESRTTITKGTSLNPGETLHSPDAQSVLTYKKNGNLVLYRNFKPVWSSGTKGTSPGQTTLQPDGNLVIYDKNGNPVWHTETHGNNNSTLSLQSDGNLVIYSQGNTPLWFTSTNHIPQLNYYVNRWAKSSTIFPGQKLQTANRKYTLRLQSDGNLVLYSNNKPIWASWTMDKDVSHLAMQSDGNLVLYSQAGKPVWHTGTNNNNGATLVLQPDGNLVIYNASFKPKWHTKTYGQ
jgi:hypothetical protein